jgi:hypothetical protein
MARSEFRESDDEELQATRRESDQQRRLTDRAGWGEYGPPESYSSKRVDVPDAPEVEPEDSERGDHADAMREFRRAYDDGIFKQALDAYRLDETSVRKAVECGALMAHACEAKRWPDAGILRRLDALHSYAAVMTDRLESTPCEVLVDSKCKPRQVGWTRGKKLAVAESVFLDDDPSHMVEVVAHEGRHRWQKDVIKGKLEHPAGEWARQNLALARAVYDSTGRDPDRYILNEIELDARSFARIAVAAYHYESQNLGRLHAGFKLASSALRSHNLSLEEDEVENSER